MIWALFVGIGSGAIAKFLMPKKDHIGIYLTVVIGVIGSLIAYGSGKSLGLYQEWEAEALFATIVGSILFLGILRLVHGK